MQNRLLGFCLLLLVVTPVFAVDADSDLNNDPYENYNRHAFKLNQTLDKIFLNRLLPFIKLFCLGLLPKVLVIFSVI